MSKVKTIHTPEEGRGVAQGDPLKSKDLKMSKVKTVPKLCLDVETARVTFSNQTSSPLGESRSRHSFGTVLTLDMCRLSFSGFVGEGHPGGLPVRPRYSGLF